MCWLGALTDFPCKSPGYASGAITGVSTYLLTFLFFVLLTGYAVGPKDAEGGGGSDLLCVPESPEWRASGGSAADDSDFERGEMVGVMYGRDLHGMFSLENNGNVDVWRHLATCVVCHVTRRSSVLVIPAMVQCPTNWTTEYTGVLMSGTYLQLVANFD